jgi:outer membrane protein OmpA-like peptidoglycan-associated protein
MKNLFTIVLLAVIGVALNAQGFQKPKFEVGLGYALKHQEGFGIPRFTFAANEFYNGYGRGLIGAYGTIEYRGGVDFKEDGTNYYFRAPIGLNFSFPKLPELQVFGGADVISYASGKNLRKEFGVRYAYDNKYSVRVGYSNWVGLTLGVGYQFPTKSSLESFELAKPKAKKSSKKSIDRVENVSDTIVVTKEIIKEVPTEVVREVLVRDTVSIVKTDTVTKTREPNYILLGTFFFEYNSTEMTTASKATYDVELRKIRAEYPNEDLLIVGNTDSTGNSTLNYNLGMGRAQRIANFLLTETGLNESKITVRSDGKIRSQSLNPDENRRVDVYILKFE